MVQSCYEGCIQNEIIALQERHIMEVPETDDINELTYKVGREFVDSLPRKYFTMASEHEVIEHASQDKKERVRKAFANLKATGYQSYYEKVKAFIKFEKADDDPFDDPVDKAPRLIQHRAYEYCSLIARFLLPIEKYVWAVGSNWKKAPVKARIFAKSLNSFQRAERIVAMNRWSDTRYYLLDHSRFDAHLTLAKLDGIEFAVYRKWLQHPLFETLLRAQYINIGTTRGGIKYKSVGRKMSGEYNTSLGDSLVNYALLWYWTRGTGAEILVDGDDSVVAISRSREHLLDHGFFEKVGMKTKVEIADSVELVDFCQCRPVEYKPGSWRLVRNPWRVFNRSPYTIRNYPNPSAYMDWLMSVGRGELAMNLGIPVLQAYAWMLVRRAAGGQVKTAALREVMQRRDRFTEQQILNNQPVEISPTARASFALAFDISIAEQRRLEDIFSSA